jgi:DNA-binding beta-propeller fold protein YncE
MADERRRAGSLPSITPLADANTQLISVGPHPDWLIGANGHVWVTGIDGGVAVFEPVTGRRIRSIAIDGELCGAPDAGFDSVWFPTCGPAAIHRVASATFELTASIPVDLPPSGEFTIGAGERGVWAVLEERDGPGRLAGIDPDTDRIADVFEIPSGAFSVRAGHGGLWVAYPGEGRVRRIDPDTGGVVATIETERGPRFLVVGADGVWVLNQRSGSVTRIDAASDTIVATIEVDGRSMKGGDIAIGHGSIWVRGTNELVAQIDPLSNTVVARFGAPSAGSASVAVVDGQLWISAGTERLLYRIPLA